MITTPNEIKGQYDSYAHIKNRIEEIGVMINTCDMPRIVEEIRSLSDYTGRMLGYDNIARPAYDELSREIKHLSDNIRDECTCDKKVWVKRK